MGSHFAGTFSCLMRTISKARQYRLEGLEWGSATDSASWMLKCFLKRLFDVTGPVKIWSPYFPFFFLELLPVMLTNTFIIMLMKTSSDANLLKLWHNQDFKGLLVIIWFATLFRKSIFSSLELLSKNFPWFCTARNSFCWSI